MDPKRDLSVTTNKNGRKVLQIVTTFSETEHQTLEYIEQRITKLELTLDFLKSNRDFLKKGVM